MKKSLSTFIFLFYAFISYCQSSELKGITSLDPSDVFYSLENKKHAKTAAQKHISIGCPFLLLFGGISPTVYANDSVFEEAYNITFYEFGCVVIEYKIAAKYNKTIFKHLSREFGSVWKKEVRKDVVGLRGRSS